MNYRAWNHRCWLISYTTNEQRSKMNYRAWNHRCWLISYTTNEQRLLQKIAEDQSYTEETASYGHNADIVQVVKVIAFLIYLIYCI
ncbi:unnamed protein product [Trifolium pratense]|uniref:Uncharacterized protein n=1 Tax=Trifolium pratense TaxID=57577 RepID=A0ACB0JB02_TRIPR|nr:unnamed protein product [Trifolium pratense]